jgi:hypothetical protein
MKLKKSGLQGLTKILGMKELADPTTDGMSSIVCPKERCFRRVSESESGDSSTGIHRARDM